ncbi:salicylate hydroxylase [Shimia isoporae]|uniref:Salicylate hydroxylase n=1 Tax=Shimia isoporae TaxID=647720 RepID=A0A4R1NPE0_9RHOB|nr:FAD-dependent monooxygenase [Shimia isoporae]TCL09711.1 salicylate hydroxylase [Shimia isoporae]
MDLNGLKVTVIGAGIGGLTAALVLRQRGASVTVLEQAEAITEVGAGLQVSPNGMVVLRALGLESELQANAVRGTAVELRDYARGRLVSRLDLTTLGPDAPYHFIHRADLINVLADAVRAAGVKILLLQKVEDIEPGERPRIVLAHGQSAKADLVVGADGLHSQLRSVLNGTVAPFFTRQVAWRATVPNTINHPPVAKVHMGPHRHVVSYPLRDGKLVNIVAVQERTGWHEEGWHIADNPENLRSYFSDFQGETKDLLAEIQDVRKWGLFRHPVAPTWYRDNTVLLGDAAHPTLPFMAQGAVMAMEDAWVLGDALVKADDINTGLSAYQARRHDRVRRVVDTASKNAGRYHLSAAPVRLAAHFGLSLASMLAPKSMMSHFDWIYRYDVTKEL